MFRVLAFLIGLNGLSGIVLSFMGDGPEAFARGAVSLLLAWALYAFGTWLKGSAKATAR